jgi:formylglycine-generating enzyme required for sulfatase activity
MLFCVFIGVLILCAASTRADNTVTLIGTYAAGGQISPLNCTMTHTATQGVWSVVLTYTGYASGTSLGTMTVTNLQNGSVLGTGLVGASLWGMAGVASNGNWAFNAWDVNAQPPIYYSCTLTNTSGMALSSNLMITLHGSAYPAGTNLELVLIWAGEFNMGEVGIAEPVHHVTISHPFYMSKHETTEGQFEQIMGYNPLPGNPAVHAVAEVPVYDAFAFCTNVGVQSGQRVRLPTEAEWEYACRAGTTTTYFWGTQDYTLYAWFASYSSAVGQKLPNPWGLYDMSGDVWEYCQDFWGPYSADSVTDPQGAASGQTRVIRGGSGHAPPSDGGESASHDSQQYFDYYHGIGFRVVVEAAPTPTPLVTIISPTNHAIFTAGDNMTLSANATENGGSISKVEFYQGSTKLGEVTTTPYSLLWSNVAPGIYSLTAKAIDNNSQTTTSSAVSINVSSIIVSITSPAGGSVFNEGDNITINASAYDVNGAITKVEFYQGGTKLGEDTTSPYSVVWNNVTAGVYSLTARAMNNNSQTTTSSAVSINVRSTNNTPTGSVGLNFGANQKAMAASDSAGAVVSLANWNNLSNGSGWSSSILNSVGGASGMAVAWSDFGTWAGGNSAANGDEKMMYAYADDSTRGGAPFTPWRAYIAVSNIAASTYDVYVYFGAGGPGGYQTTGINGMQTYAFWPMNANTNSFPRDYRRATSIAGVSAVTNGANYAVWSNLTASSFIITHTVFENVCNGGVAGVQIVMHGGSGTTTNKTPHGVPYSWLSANGITNNQAQAENLDPDGDGAPTWKEYYAGTDPNAKGSVFKILAMSTNRSITWYGTTNNGVTNRFEIYRNTNLLLGSWQLVGTNIARSTTGTNVWTDSSLPSSPLIYYRAAVPVSTL